VYNVLIPGFTVLLSRLGKTLQSLVGVALSHCSNESGSKRSLVVCPSSVTGKSQDGWLLCNFTCILTLGFLTNQGHWVSEIRRFFPGSQVLSPFDFTGPAKLRRRRWKDDAHHHNIVVTSYSVLRADVDLLEQVLWNYCILDEGHLLKNPKTSK
jgi:TATA-binding protein-associated factor